MIDLSDDPDVTNVLKFLREREVVHFQRFGEALRTVQEKLAQKKFYMNNNMGTCATNMNLRVIIGNNSDDNNSCGCSR